MLQVHRSIIVERADLGRTGQLQHKGQWVPLDHWPVATHHLHMRPLAAHRQAQEQVQDEEPQRSGLPVLRLLVEDQISGTTPEHFRRLFLCPSGTTPLEQRSTFGPSGQNSVPLGCTPAHKVERQVERVELREKSSFH